MRLVLQSPDDLGAIVSLVEFSVDFPADERVYLRDRGVDVRAGVLADNVRAIRRTRYALNRARPKPTVKARHQM